MLTEQERYNFFEGEKERQEFLKTIKGKKIRWSGWSDRNTWVICEEYIEYGSFFNLTYIDSNNTKIIGYRGFIQQGFNDYHGHRWEFFPEEDENHTGEL